MTDDRSAFTEARDAGLRARHETREARAIRKQVAEEIAQAIEACVRDLDQWPGEFYREAAAKAREIGSKEITARPCQPGCEFVAPHPSHPLRSVHEGATMTDQPWPIWGNVSTYAPDATECVKGHPFTSEADCILPEGWDNFLCRTCINEAIAKDPL